MNWLTLLCIVVTLSKPQIQYPIRFAYVNRIDSWWPIKDVAKGMGVPGYASKTIYNMFALTVWTYEKGPLDLAKLWNDPVTYLSEQSDFGRSNTQIRKSIKQKYVNASVKLLVSAFAESEYPTTAGVNPILCATKLALFVKDTGLDGVDINYEDEKAFEDGTAQIWVIKFMKKLRELLPNSIISHAPQASNFHQNKYKNGGYYTIHNQVGNLIDFYNVQFYNQKAEEYTTYETLFKKSIPNSYMTGTSVMQLNKKGIPLKKIVIGKPATQLNVMNTGLVSGKDLGQFVMKGYKQFGWFAGVMVWEYVSDSDGKFIQAAAGQLVESFLFDQLSSIFQTEPSQPSSTQKKNDKVDSGQNFSELQFLTAAPINTQQQKKKAQPYVPRDIKYPIRFTTVDRISSWWPPEAIAASIGVPGYANDSFYNYYSLSAWTYKKGPMNMAKLWQNPIKYFTNSSSFGSTNQSIRATILENFHRQKIGLLISAFGSSQNPITEKIEAGDCANKLAKYVKDNQLDGVEIKFMDTKGLESGIGEFWVIKFQTQLRKLLPNHLIVHTTFPSYFNQSHYRMGGYSLINQAVGNSIDFYILYYFDQGDDTPFQNYKEVFMLSGPPSKFGTSVRQLMYRGVPSYKIVVGKPALKQNSSNTGWMDVEDLAMSVTRAYKEMRWYTGIMIWEYYSDMNQKMIKSITEELIILCAASQNSCHP